jgi:uncharacterized protein (UPF0261 family)
VLEHRPGETLAAEEGREAATRAMAAALASYLAGRDDVDGVIAVGGSTGASIVAPAMQRLPLGLPKLIVSTVAAGDVGRFVGASDIAMMYPVVDLAGLNRLTRRVLANAADAIAGMAMGRTGVDDERETGLPTVALTILGLTTRCVRRVAQELRGRVECQMFPSVPAGARSLGRLVEDGYVDGVVDVTASDVARAALLGDSDAVDARFAAIARRGIPYVGSCGGADFVVVGGGADVPPELAGRKTHRHNANVTLVRTTADDCAKIGRLLATKINDFDDPVRLLLPEGGLSELGEEGGVFHDAEADEALFASLADGLAPRHRDAIVRIDVPLNDGAFAERLASAYVDASRQVAAA